MTAPSLCRLGCRGIPLILRPGFRGANPRVVEWVDPTSDPWHGIPVARPPQNLASNYDKITQTNAATGHKNIERSGGGY